MASDRSRKFKNINMYSIIGFAVGTTISVLMFVRFIGFPPNFTSSEEDLSPNSASTLKLDHTGVSASPLTFKEVLGVESPTKRKALLHALIQGKTEEQIIDLIQESDTFDSKRKVRDVQNRLFEELARINPQAALKQIWLMENYRWKEFVKTVFSEWGRLDVEESLREATKLDGALRTESVRAVLTRHGRLSDTELSNLAKLHGIGPITERVHSEAKARRLFDEPEEAIKLVLGDSVLNKSQMSLLSEIVRLWTSVDGSVAFLPLFELLHTDYGDYSDTLDVQRIVESAAEYDPQSAWNALMDMDQKVQERFHRGILRVWVRSDPSQAFDSVRQFANVQWLTDVRDYVLFEWAQINPLSLLGSIDTLPEPYRESAVFATIGELTKQQSLDEAFQILEVIESDGYEVNHAKGLLVKEWAQFDPNAAVSWILETTQNKTLRQKLLRVVLPKLALADPSRAMEVALEQPIDDSLYIGGGLEIQVIETLASNGLFAEVRAMVNDVRKTEQRNSHYVLLINLIDFNRPDEALELIQDQWKSDGVDLFSSVSAFWLQQNPIEFIDYLGRLTSREQQSAVATTLSTIDELRVMLTEDQMKFVSQLLEPDSVP